jgi:hypothetical protein
MVRCVSEWPSDPHHDWPQHFRVGDGVRLTDGRPAVVRAVVDYAPHPPSRWELIVVVEDAWGNPDAFIVEPWDCRPDTAAAQELADRGLV